MSRPRSVAAGVAVWCTVVALVASLVWVVVGRAGAGVLPTAQPRADVTGSLPIQRSSAPRHVESGVVSPRPRASSSTGTASPSAAPNTTPTSPLAPPPTAQPTQSHSPTPTAQRRSWSGQPGHVVAECRGAAARLVSAYPNTGWRYQILSRGPASVRARFLRIGEDHGSTVTARCAGGVPHFSVSAGEPGDD